MYQPSPPHYQYSKMISEIRKCQSSSSLCLNLLSNASLTLFI